MTSERAHPPESHLFLSKAETALIIHIRALVFGSVEIKVQDGAPVFIQEIRRNVKLT